jgi:hypothetical protein
LIAVFVVAVPVLFLYATGYRFERITGLTETGGIYVGAEQPGAEIYINDELVHETGTFRRAFFIQNLNPGTYTIRVSKDGYYSWGKIFNVYAHIVTEAQAFNMPREPILELIPQTFTNQTTTGTSTPVLPNPVYEEIAATFATTTATSTATSLKNSALLKRSQGIVMATSSAVVSSKTATTTKEFGGMQLTLDGGHVVARWMRTAESAPFYFCIREGECVDEITLNTKGEKPLYFDLFPGNTDLAIVTLHGGVYVSELDNRSEQNIQPLFLAPHADFRIIDGAIYVKADARIYKVKM